MPSKKNVVFVTATGGGIIAAQEIGSKSGKSIKVLYPAFASIREDKTCFVFTPLHYITGEFEIFTGGALLGKADMPEIMVADYEKYVAMQP